MSDAYRPLPEDLDGWHDRVVEMATYEKYADELKKFALTAKIFVRDKWRLEGTPSGSPHEFYLPLGQSDSFRISGELGDDGLPITARLEFYEDWRGMSIESCLEALEKYGVPTLRQTTDFLDNSRFWRGSIDLDTPMEECICLIHTKEKHRTPADAARDLYKLVLSHFSLPA